ncbi:MAG: uroporphyrinogen decarboxylase family protein [Candidatus Bipolaricaulota bacterium]|nr:hypothetical protein [Candidatus Bipolaricaulota bacterium]MBS3792061.1 hypothetical protein [Candidatus Bipolaricaulota bacterium]
MNSKDRVLKAISGREPDRVPIDVWYTPEMREKMADHLGVDDSRASEEKYYPDPVQLELGNDLLITTVGPAASYYMSDEEYYEDEWGIGWRQVDYGKGIYTEPYKHPLAEIEDPDEFEIPDFSKDERYEEANYLVDKFGDTHAIVGEISCTIFELSWYLRGFERVLRDFHTNKDFVKKYFDKLKKWAKTAGTKLVESGVDIIFLGDDVGSQDQMLISPDTFREFLKPVYAELFESFRDVKPDVKVAFHTDGNVMPIIGDYVEIGVDILNPIQPQALAPDQVKRKFGDELTLWGSIDNQSTVPFGTPEDVKKEVVSRLKNVAPGGGLILGPSHAVQPDAPVENLIAFYDTVKNSGSYPIRSSK